MPHIRSHLALCDAVQDIQYVRWKRISRECIAPPSPRYRFLPWSYQTRVYDFENKKFIQKVARVDLGTLSWIYDSSSVRSWWYSPDIASLAKKPANASTVSTTLAIYDNKTYNELSNDLTVLGLVIKYDTGNLIIRTGDTQNNPIGYLYYELATPIETDISSYLPADFNTIQISANGTITFGNTYQQAIPYEYLYLEKVGANNE